MKRILIFLYCFLLQIYLFSQPGPQSVPFIVEVKLQDFNFKTSNFKKIPKHPQQGLYYSKIYHYIIDKDTKAVDFDKIKHLKYINLIISGVSSKSLSEVSLPKLKQIYIFYREENPVIKGFPKLPSLEVCKIIDYKNGEIPNLENVKKLKLESFQAKRLPECLPNFTDLENIEISSNILETIDELIELSNLKTIKVTGKSILEFPSFLENNCIEEISLIINKSFINWQNVTKLKSLVHFSISGSDIVVVPKFKSLVLKSIALTDLPKLYDVSLLSFNTQLNYLNITRTGIKKIELDLSEMKDLQRVMLDYNSKVELIDLSQLINKNYIKLSFEESFKLKKLLTIRDSPKLKHLKGISSFHNIHELILNGPGLEFLDLGENDLKILSLYIGSKLNSFEGITKSSQLRVLEIGGTGVVQFPQSFNKLDSLRFLKIHGCHNLHDISSINNLINLESVYFFSCHTLKEIPFSFSTNQAIKYFEIYSMDSLSTAPGLVNLLNLNSIHIKYVNPNFKLPAKLSSSAMIQTILIEGKHYHIDMIKELNNLTYLKLTNYQGSELPQSIFTNKNIAHLDIGLSEIEHVNGIEQLKMLKYLDLSSNFKLKYKPTIDDLKRKNLD